MDWLNIVLILLAICLVLVIFSRVANNLIKTALISICVIFISGMLWATFSGDEKSRVSEVLNNVKNYIVEFAKDIFQSGQDNSGKLNEIKDELDEMQGGE